MRSYAERARLGHVTPAWVSQVMSLLQPAPDIHEAALFLPRIERGRDPIILRDLLSMATIPVGASNGPWRCWTNTRGRCPPGWVTGDDEMGRSRWFREQLRQRQAPYRLAVPSTWRCCCLGS